MKKSVEFEKGWQILKNMAECKDCEEREPQKRKDADKEPYLYCKYIDAGMEGMKCHKGLEYRGSCRHLNGYVCTSYEPKREETKPKDAVIKNQTEFEKGEWSMFETITSVEYGKQRFFLEKDGRVYDKQRGDYLDNVEKAYARYYKEKLGY